MSLGQVQTIFLCSSEDQGLGQGACPPGLFLNQTKAFILHEDSANYFSNIDRDFDYTQASAFFAVAFVSVVSLYLVSKMAGTILQAIRTF